MLLVVEQSDWMDASVGTGLAFHSFLFKTQVAAGGKRRLFDMQERILKPVYRH